MTEWTQAATSTTANIENSHLIDSSGQFVEDLIKVLIRMFHLPGIGYRSPDDIDKPGKIINTLYTFLIWNCGRGVSQSDMVGDRSQQDR
jgi:hypothetical protein